MGFNCLKATEPLQLVVQGGSSFSLILLCALFQLLTPKVQYLEPALHMGSMCDYVTIWRKQVSCKFHSSVITTTMNQCSLGQFWMEYLYIISDLYWNFFQYIVVTCDRNVSGICPKLLLFQMPQFPNFNKMAWQ